MNGQDSNTASVAVTVQAPPVEPTLTIHQFKTTNQARLSRGDSVAIELRVRNTGTILQGSALATVVGVQNGATVYNRTLQVSHNRQGGNSSFDFPAYTPTFSGDITWTVTLRGATATASTRVRQ